MKETFLELLLDMKVIKSEEDIKPSIIEYYLKSATDFVMYYVGKQGWEYYDYQENFETQIINIAIYMYKSSKDSNQNIQSKTQGSRSITYRGFSIPEDYYKHLPRYPKIWGDSNMIPDNGVSCNQACANSFFNQCT